MTCFNEKNQHIGNLETLARYNTDGYGEIDAVVEWCPKCGAVVIYKEYDCRMVGNYVNMKFPKITKAVLKKKKKPQQGVYKSLWEEEWTVKK